MIKSARLSYDKMKIEDVKEFKNWEKHESTIYDDYNFYEETDEQIEEWYLWKTSFGARYYTIFLKEEPIGYIGFKNIREYNKSATLGLVLNPYYIGKKYGEEALFSMGDVFFNDWKFQKLYLKVARYNQRAVALYKKLGFKKYATSVMIYPNEKPDKDDVEYIKNKKSFLNILGKTFFYADKMVLDRNYFNEVIKCTSSYRN
ncbi:putative acetyltransferase, GNAT family [Peptoniphilus sp. ING2-D1G]|nr:putative acetyltransferase, GNAT family [Peptoniphilus sp. ING2-D1G]